MLLMAGELDGGLPILRRNILVGLIPAPELEYALDRLENEDEAMCLMCIDTSYGDWSDGRGEGRREEDSTGPTDFTPYIDPVRFCYITPLPPFLLQPTTTATSFFF